MNLSVNQCNIVPNNYKNINFGMNKQNTKKANEINNDLRSNENEFFYGAMNLKNFVTGQLNSPRFNKIKLQPVEVFHSQVLKEEGSNEEAIISKNYNGMNQVKKHSITLKDDDITCSWSKEGASNLYKIITDNDTKTVRFTDKSNNLQEVVLNDKYANIKDNSVNLINSALDDAHKEIKENKILPKIDYFDDYNAFIPIPVKISEEFSLKDGDILRKDYNGWGKVHSETLKTKDGIIMSKDEIGNHNIYFDQKDKKFIGLETCINSDENKSNSKIIFDKNIASTIM